MRARVFNIMQYEKHPETGETLITEDKIKEALEHKTIKQWAYICHDKDVYSEKDEKNDTTGKRKAGDKKPRHWHIVCRCESALEVGVIARWFGIAENFVDVAKGKGAGAFLDCVEYLTHENPKQQALGKHLYPDKEVKANFDFRDELIKRTERKLRYGRDLDEKDRIRNEVLFHGMTIRDVIDKYPLQYQEDFRYLEQCRLRYISTIAPMPKVRINYYIEGKGGMGKGLISKAIARALVDRDGTMNDDDIYFEVGADKTSFEGYDGQPVIIWNDCRAFTLLEKLGGRENVFNVFDPFPPNIKQNIKYGSVRLNNSINIVNSVDTWSTFLDGLAGEYTDKHGNVRRSEDKGQSYRRFPFFLVLHENDYDLGMNKGVFNGTREYEQYKMYNGLRGNMQRIADKCGNNYTLYNVVTKKAVTPVLEHHDELVEKLSHEQQGTDEEILEEFKDVGTPDPNRQQGAEVTSNNNNDLFNPEDSPF